MTRDEVRAFLTSDPPRPGVLATTRRDGRPHAAPLWYVVDDDGTIVFTTGADTVKGRTLQRRGWATMTVDDDRPYFFRYFRWRTLPELLALKDRGGLPLLDWGYPVLIVALGIYLLATLACAVAFSIETLIAARFLQAVGGTSMS